MDYFYTSDYGQYLSRLQSTEDDIIIRPVEADEAKTEDPNVYAPMEVNTSWGNITGIIDNQLDLIERLQKLKEEIQQQLPSGDIFTYKGQVETYNDLPATAENGDVYDVKDTGANYVYNGTGWDKLSENLEGFAKIAQLQELETRINELITQVTENIDEQLKLEKQAREDAINTLTTDKLDKTVYEEYVQKAEADLQLMTLQMEELETKIVALKSLDAEVVVLYDGSDTEFTNKEKDFQLSGQVTVPTSVMGNSITLKEGTLSASSMYLVAADDITIKDTVMDGILPLKISEAVFSLHADDFISVRTSTLNPENAYNGIDIGSNTGLAKSVTIDHVSFDGHFVNNAINVYGMANNGVITISNCYFKDVKNILRLSNRANTSYTVNIVNCTCDKWDTTEYGGMILLQDYTSTSAEEADANNQFANITINIQNLTKPDGNKLQAPDNLGSICATGDENQIIYMFDDYRGITPYGDKYPIISIK